MLLGEGWIYAAREDGTPLVKIGCTANQPKERLAGLRRQFGCPIALVGIVWVSNGTLRVERIIHNILAPQQIEKEWFYLHMDQDTLECLVIQAQEVIARGPGTGTGV